MVILGLFWGMLVFFYRPQRSTIEIGNRLPLGGGGYRPPRTPPGFSGGLPAPRTPREEKGDLSLFRTVYRPCSVPCSVYVFRTVFRLVGTRNDETICRRRVTPNDSDWLSSCRQFPSMCLHLPIIGFRVCTHNDTCMSTNVIRVCKSQFILCLLAVVPPTPFVISRRYS